MRRTLTKITLAVAATAAGLLAAVVVAAGLGMARLAMQTAWADSWEPPMAERYVDGAGDRHVVVKPSGAFTYARRGEGLEPVTHLRDDGDWRESDIPIRDGDVVLARGALPHTPIEVSVSDAGLGFVAFDQHGGAGYGKIVVIVDGKGQIRRQLALEQVFPDTNIETTFTHTTSSIWWHRGGWIDDAERAVVVVAHAGLVRVLDLTTGDGRDGQDDDFVRALSHPQAAARDLALELMAERSVVGADHALAGLVADSKWPMSTRLRAALVLGKRGDLRGRVLFEDASAKTRAEAKAGEQDLTDADHEFAVKNLSTFLEDAQALIRLRELMRGPAGPAWHEAQLGFAALGEKAVPTLLEMLAETDQTSDYRGGAAHALKRIGSRTALEGLLAAVGDEDDYTANAAANAAIAIGGDDCADAFVAHLLRGCTQDSRIASYFEDLKHEPAIPALIESLARAQKDYGRMRAAKALQFQTGQRIGEDVEQWRTWWTSHKR